MKHAQKVFALLFLGLSGCSDLNGELRTDMQEVFLTCVDMVTTGGALEVVINSQQEYDQLIFQRFTKPLQDYWNANYPSVLRSITNRYPGLTDQQYADSVRRILYSVLPFRGTEKCSHPGFDFSRYTLLGQDSHGGGCSQPTYATSILRDDQNGTVTFTVNILQHGNCAMGFSRNTWVLVPKVPPGYTIRFQKHFSRDSRGEDQL